MFSQLYLPIKLPLWKVRLLQGGALLFVCLLIAVGYFYYQKDTQVAKAEGISQINKIWRAEGQLFDDWYNEPDTLLVEYLLENLGLAFTSIQKVDPQSGQFVTFKTNE